MRKRQPNDTDLSFCIANGVKIYPVRAGATWYIEVDNNGKKKRYQKPISNAYALTGNQLMDPVHKTAKYWAKVIQKNHDRIHKNGSPDHPGSSEQNGDKAQDSKGG